MGVEKQRDRVAIDCEAVAQDRVEEAKPWSDLSEYEDIFLKGGRERLQGDNQYMITYDNPMLTISMDSFVGEKLESGKARWVPVQVREG